MLLIFWVLDWKQNGFYSFDEIQNFYDSLKDFPDLVQVNVSVIGKTSLDLPIYSVSLLPPSSSNSKLPFRARLNGF